MDIEFFHRHEVLSNETLDYHAETMQMIDKIRYAPNNRNMTDYERDSWKDLYKYLNAIYDGVLYETLTKKSYIDRAMFQLLIPLKIALRLYTIIGMISCSRTSVRPITSTQELMYHWA